ncbi:MAG TPA: YdbL family protein [Alphaproteobacteria bacterium]|nr:YdbL family protein [Alphaproteobacteria bacterium]
MTRWMFVFALIAGLFVLMPCAPARAAMDLASAKAQGLVGERPDGLVGIVSPPGPPELQAMVGGVNDGRLETYRDIGAKQGTPLAQVQALAGQSLISKTPSGQYIMIPGGVWKKVP